MTRNLRVVAALGRRAVKQAFRRPQFIAPVVVFPSLLLAVNTGGAGRAVDIPSFPDVNGFLDFELAGAMLQSTMIAGLGGGIALALDIEMGFIDRLLAAPIPRWTVLAGRLVGSYVLGMLSATWFIVAGLAFGVSFEGGPLGVLLLLVVVPLSAVVFGGFAAALALRSGRASVVQGMFPIVFVILFLSSAFFPQDLMLEPAGTIAEWNPLSFIAEGTRHLVIEGTSAAAVAEALLGIAIIGGIAFALAAAAIRARLRSA